MGASNNYTLFFCLKPSLLTAPLKQSRPGQVSSLSISQSVSLSPALSASLTHAQNILATPLIHPTLLKSTLIWLYSYFKSCLPHCLCSLPVSPSHLSFHAYHCQPPLLTVRHLWRLEMTNRTSWSWAACMWETFYLRCTDSPDLLTQAAGMHSEWRVCAKLLRLALILAEILGEFEEYHSRKWRRDATLWRGFTHRRNY